MSDISCILFWEHLWLRLELFLLLMMENTCYVKKQIDWDYTFYDGSVMNCLH